MSSPVLWIGIPLFSALILFFLRRWKSWVIAAGTLICLVLATLAWQVTLGDIVVLGRWSFTISDRVIFFGRQLILDNGDRSILALIYLVTAFWFGGAISVKVHRMFIPLGLGMVAILVAALSVEPFLYAALLIQIAILMCVPLLSPPGKEIQPGVLRFLSYQSLGMPFILFAGWLFSGVEITIGDLALAYRSVVMLGLGFAFLLAIFPLYTWITMLSEEAHPYIAAFVFITIPSVVTLFGFAFISRYPWIGDIGVVLPVLRIIGVLMVASGGVMAAFQRHLGRILGYAVVVEIGRAVLALSLPEGQAIYHAMLLPRVLALGVWALALSIMRYFSEDLRFKTIQGLGRQFPVLGVSVAIAQLSLGGFPLLAGFPVYLILFRELSQISSTLGLWNLLGSFGLLVGSFRSLAVLVIGPEDIKLDGAKPEIHQILLVIGVVGILFIGLFPQLILPLVMNLPQVFQLPLP
jgi:NADH-quinone oxidoreductase subunit N